MQIPDLRDPHSLALITDAMALMGRLCLGVLFVAGAVQKAIAPEVAQDMLIAQSWPGILVWPALIFNGVAAVCLIFGAWLGLVALLLALYCMGTSIFHHIPDDPWQMSIFVKNWAIAGGLLILCSTELRHPRG
tara:strand:+ start:798 stop:1196 length:399 start_codon:yes stop_codon:yes gene_type:complete